MSFVVYSIVALTLAVLAITISLTGKHKVFSEARAMTAPAFALTMIPAFYTVLGTIYQVDLMASDGLAQWWLYALSWYPGYILMIFLAGVIRATGPHITLPDRFLKYGRTAEILAAVACFLYLMPMDVMYTLGWIGQLLTDYTLPLELFTVVFGAGLILFTCYKGWAGYALSGILFFIGIGTLGISSVALMGLAGGWGTIKAALPAGMFTPWFGDLSGFFNLLKDPATALWFLMGTIFLIDPMVWQRVSLTESSKATGKGMIFAFAFWALFDVTTVFSGLAIATMWNPETAWLLDTAFYLAPQVLGGVIIAASLLCVIAGGNAYLHAGGMIVSQNIAKALGVLPEDTLSRDEEAKRWYRIGVAVLGTLTILLVIVLNSFMPADPTTLFWLVVSAILFGGIGFPLIFGGLFFRDRVPSLAVTLGIVFGLAATLACLGYGFIAPEATSVLTLGILKDTATATPYIDASRIVGLGASIVGYALGWVASMVSGGE